MKELEVQWKWKKHPRRLKWHGHVMRRMKNMSWKEWWWWMWMGGEGEGRPKRTGMDSVNVDLRGRGLSGDVKPGCVKVTGNTSTRHRNGKRCGRRSTVSTHPLKVLATSFTLEGWQQTAHFDFVTSNSGAMYLTPALFTSSRVTAEMIWMRRLEQNDEIR